jgi:hypothetical protein
MGYGEQKGGLAMYNALVLAAEYALALGGPAELADAERFARSAYEIAAVDSTAVGRSALVGETSLLLAKVERARGDEARAMPWAERAVPPLTNGYGPAHPKTRDARTLLDTLRRRTGRAHTGD